VYLDSPDLKLYHSTINGDKNRFKLRLRFYSRNDSDPVYLEIKRRLNNSISKQRAGIRREMVEQLMASHWPDPNHLISNTPKQLFALEDFCRLTNDLRARPCAHVSYLREAWVSHDDNSVRVTMDRQVSTEVNQSFQLNGEMSSPVLVFGGKVVVELKFTDRFPDWFKELVRVFGLVQCGAAKYADGVTQLGDRVVSSEFAWDGYHAAAQARLQRIDGTAAVSSVPSQTTLSRK
jgi:hypothetical protein